jgi:hypothetical protein
VGYDFQVINRVCGIEVGFYSDFEGKTRHSLLELCRRKNLFTWAVRSILDWCRKLGVGTKHFHVQFVWPGSWGVRVHMGKAITGKRGHALLLLEADIFNGELCLYTIDYARNDPKKIFCEDIVPHELMHILDTRQGRSPSMFPFVLPGEGEWIDLFRHLWIDGHLERRGFPHFPKDERIRELSKRVGREKAERLASIWWGRPMTLHETVTLGLEAGLTLEADCPLAVWYKNPEGR